MRDIARGCLLKGCMSRAKKIQKTRIPVNSVQLSNKNPLTANKGFLYYHTIIAKAVKRSSSPVPSFREPVAGANR
jgi:hypothetical protein